MGGVSIAEHNSHEQELPGAVLSQAVGQWGVSVDLLEALISVLWSQLTILALDPELFFKKAHCVRKGVCPIVELKELMKTIYHDSSPPIHWCA